MSTNRLLTGSVALVTGAGRRLGQHIALSLAEAGADVAVHYNMSESGAKETAARAKDFGVRAVTIQGDLSSEEGVGEVFDQLDQQLGSLDILVNNASVFDRFGFEQLNASRWQHALDVNLTAPYLCSREAALRMRRKSKKDKSHVAGHIINMADIAADRPWKGYTHYCVSKAGVVMLTKALALELAPEIRVNAIAPGAILPQEGASEQDQQKAIDRVPLGTWGTPAAVSRAIVFLVAHSDYMTGTVLRVDGGRSIAW